MGRNTVSAGLRATLSDHNDERDVRDLKLWEELQARIKAILLEERYEEIGAWLS